MAHPPAKTSVKSFLLLAFLLSWPVLLCGFGWFSPEENVLLRYLFSCTGMLMVAFSALITRAWIERRGFADVGWKVGRVKWYLTALAFNALLWLGPPLAAWSFGKLAWNRDLQGGELLVVMLSLGGVSLLAGFGEEFGWRGYLLPRMLNHAKTAREALFLVGLIWGLWHCAVAIGPFLRTLLEGSREWISMVIPTLLACLRMIASSLVLSFIFGAVWLRTQSIFVSTFLHGSWLALRDAMAHLVDYPPIFSLVTLAGVLAAWWCAEAWLRRNLRSIQEKV